MAPQLTAAVVVELDALSTGIVYCELGWPLTELGRIRLQIGDIQGAEEAFLAAHEVGWDPQPGLALVHLAQGNVALGVESIRDALAHPLNIP